MPGKHWQCRGATLIMSEENITHIGGQHYPCRRATLPMPGTGSGADGEEDFGDEVGADDDADAAPSTSYGDGQERRQRSITMATAFPILSPPTAKKPPNVSSKSSPMGSITWTGQNVTRTQSYGEPAYFLSNGEVTTSTSSLRMSTKKRPPTTQGGAAKLRTEQEMMPRFSKVGGPIGGGLAPVSL